MLHTRIDLNADLGEGRGDDAAIFPFLSSANIACGAHAGSTRTMDIALAEAARLGITVGAHVSYEDRERFGRTDVDVPQDELRAQLTQQIAKLQHLASRFGVAVRYVKPHGALYHRIAHSTDHAHALIDAVRSCDPSLELLVPYSPMLQRLASPLHCRHEFFADRAYSLDGRLLDRSLPGALLTEADAVAERVLRWLQTGEVLSVEGKSMRIDAQSICVHGDTPHAVQIAQALHTTLLASGIRVCNWAEQ